MSETGANRGGQVTVLVQSSDVAVKHCINVSIEAVLIEVRQHASKQGHFFQLLVDAFHATGHKDLALWADMRPLVADHKLRVRANHPTLGLSYAIQRLRKAVVSVGRRVVRAPHLVERHHVNHILSSLSAEKPRTSGATMMIGNAGTKE